MKVQLAAILSIVAFIAVPAEAKLKTIYAFCSTDCLDGIEPTGTLAMDSSGRIYGVAGEGGDQREGSVFMLTPHGNAGKRKFQQIFEFCSNQDCPTGHQPVRGVVVDTAGNLYGVATMGPSNARGTIFELMPNRRKTVWTAKVLYEFCPSGSNCADGDGPNTRLTYAGQASGVPYDGSSPLYGTTDRGGGANDGTVFKLTSDGKGNWSHTVMYDFCQQANCTDGALPLGDLTIDGNGNIFGTAQGGGTKSQGIVFELGGESRRRSSSFTVLHDFCSQAGCGDGGLPTAGVTLDGAGQLFGTAQGGSNDSGLIFELTPQGSNSPYVVRYEFCSVPGCRDGATPTNPLLIDSSGNLFGATEEGGTKNGSGTVFELTSGGVLKTLYAFCRKGGTCSDGAVPNGGLIIDGAGQLFGTTKYGGKKSFADGGTIYQITP